MRENLSSTVKLCRSMYVRGGQHFIRANTLLEILEFLALAVDL